MSKETQLIKEIVTMIERHGVIATENVIYKSKENLIYNNIVGIISRCVCKAFNVNMNVLFSIKKEGNKRRSQKEVEAMVYFIILIEIYGKMDRNKIFEILKFDKSKQRFYYSKYEDYGLDNINMNIPKHKEIYAKYKVAEQLIIEELKKY